MADVTIPVKGLRRVIQGAKDLHERNVMVGVQKGAVHFKIGRTTGGDITLFALGGKEKK